MPIEYMRQEPPDEREAFTCALCEDDFDYTGGETVINENIVCDVCAVGVADQAGYFDRALKAEREVKRLRDALKKAQMKLNSTQRNWDEQCLFECNDIMTKALKEQTE